MTPKRTIGFVVLSIIMLTSANCRQAHVATVSSVNIDNNCSLDNDPVKIKTVDTVTWFAKDQDYTLLFKNSPFVGITSGTPFTVTKGQSYSSGAVIPALQGFSCWIFSCDFKYSVTGTGAAACTKDPVVVIDR